MANDLEGQSEQTFALVIGEAKVAMLAEPISSGNCLSGTIVTLVNGSDGSKIVAVSSEEDITRVKTWSFESIEGSTNVYLTSGTGDAKQYVKISGADVTLTSNQAEASEITVAEGTGEYEGMIQLRGADNNINLYGGVADRGFGGWRDDGPNEWFYVVSNIRVKGNASTVQGITPNGSIVHLFDYWVTDRVSTSSQGDYGEGYHDTGINNGHTLKFAADNNGYTGSVAPEKGLVKSTLVNGYPELVSNDESLSYLFDPNESVSVDGNSCKDSFGNARGLLQIDNEGYYYYDSKLNYAEFDKGSNEFTLYDDWGVFAGGTSPNGQFFPFNKFNEVASKTSKYKDINHYFGMTLTSRFIQQYDGCTDVTKVTPMKFEFAGDDDVWIFIDGVLVADLGGIHDASSAKINFATGEVIVNEGTNHQETTNLYDIYTAAGQADSVGWNIITNPDNTTTTIFENNSYHTLKLFYLERGNMDSNLHLKYNLTTYPPTSISKVDQYGNPVENAKFAVYPANENYEMLNAKNGSKVDLPENYSYDSDGNIIDSSGNIIVKALYVGATDSEGNMGFVDADYMPYTIAEIEDLLGTNFILKEIEVPAGYRLIDSNINLYIVNHRVLQCANTSESGVHTRPNLLVTAPNVIKKNISDDEITFYEPDSAHSVNGTLFAVVMKYIGPRDENGNATALAEQLNWAPVYGNSDEGFTVVKVNGYDDFINEVVKAAQLYDDYHNGESCEFSMSASGAMQAVLNGLPGDIQKYYYMLNEDEKLKTEYTVAYYWSEASNIDGATQSNTCRINANAENYQFSRTFGATVSVPNMINHMQVQKLDEGGNPMKDAKFAIYNVNEVDNKIYYVAGNNLIYLEKDYDGDNKGNASTSDGRSGTYTVNSDNGVITVEIDGNTITISPAVNAKNKSLLKTTLEDGILDFYYMEKGKYYIREIAAPSGYTLNPTEIMTLVTNGTAYVNAGTADDGVAVSRGPGYISSTMHQYASIGDIDNTLSWIYTQLKISPESTSFEDVNSDNYYNQWKYIKNDYANDFDADTTDVSTERRTTYLQYTSKYATDDINYNVFEESKMAEISNNCSDNSSNKSKLSTNVGWSFLNIYQNYPYGMKIEKDFTGHYANWWKNDVTDNSEEPKDISALFTRTLRVEVSDNPTSNLEISKSVVGAEVGSNDTFRFTVTLTDENDVALTEKYVYKIYNITDDNKREQIRESFVKSGGQISLGDKQVAVIYNLPKGSKYKVTEEKNEKYITTAKQDGSKYTFKDNELSVDGTLKWNKADNSVDNISIVDYVNSRNFGGEEIPSTGGRGLTVFYIMGIIMMLVTVCIYEIKSRHKKEGC